MVLNIYHEAEETDFSVITENNDRISLAAFIEL